MQEYEVVLGWSDDDGVFVAEVPELPGCMAHGDTREAALENAKHAMDLWIETAQEFGDPIPEAKGGYHPERSRSVVARISEAPRPNSGGVDL